MVDVLGNGRLEPFKASFVGVGKVGRTLGNDLLRIKREPTDRKGMQNNHPLDSHLFNPARFDITPHLRAADIIFLAGAHKELKEHEGFDSLFLVKQLAISCEPTLLVTLEMLPADFQGILYAGRCPGNECFVPLRKPYFRGYAVKLIQDVCRAFALPGLINANPTELKMILHGCDSSYCRIFEGENADEFIQFMGSNELSESCGCHGAFAMFSFSHKAGSNPDQISRLASALLKFIPGDPRILVSWHIIQDLKPLFRATVLIPGYDAFLRRTYREHKIGC